MKKPLSERRRAVAYASGSLWRDGVDELSTAVGGLRRYGRLALSFGHRQRDGVVVVFGRGEIGMSGCAADFGCRGVSGVLSAVGESGGAGEISVQIFPGVHWRRPLRAFCAFSVHLPSAGWDLLYGRLGPAGVTVSRRRLGMKLHQGHGEALERSGGKFSTGRVGGCPGPLWCGNSGRW